MPGLVPGIHVFHAAKAWMAGTSPAMTLRVTCPSSTPAARCRRLLPPGFLERQDGVVRRHLERVPESEVVPLCELAKLGDVPHAPFRILPPQAFVERGVARRGVDTVALERAVQQQLA